MHYDKCQKGTPETISSRMKRILWDLQTSSMSGKLEYLEKYSVAPSPSRDYYGLKVSDDQVTLYIWRISHGPHKTPIVRSSDFADFKHDLQLQDEIHCIFGEFFLKHVQSIASGTNTLLTLPKLLIEKLVKYLTVKDIVKLSSLSHISNEIFNDNIVWQTLYNRSYNRSPSRNKLPLVAKETCNWKQLFQLSKVQGTSNERKMLRTRPTTKLSKPNPKIENSLRTNINSESTVRSDPKVEMSLKNSHSNSRTMPKVIPVETIQQSAKKLAETSRKRNTLNVPSKKIQDYRLGESVTDRTLSERKGPTMKSLQMTGQKNMKTLKDQTTTNKNLSKRENESKDFSNNKLSEFKGNKTQSKTKSVDSKGSNQSIKGTDEKFLNPKTKNLTTSKTHRTEKTRSVQSDQSKPKTKGKPKKIGQSKSTIFNTTSSLLGEHSTIRDDSFDLANLIEASLKNIRSPRSIFDYSFSCIEKPKPCAGDTRAQDILRRMAEHPRALKSAQNKATLDRLSEKSEPLTAKSADSGRKSEVSRESATPKRVKASITGAKKSSDLNKNSSKVVGSSEKSERVDKSDIYNKYPTPRMGNNLEDKNITSKKEIDKMSILRSLGSRSLYGKGITTPEMNGPELKNTMDDIYKYL